MIVELWNESGWVPQVRAGGIGANLGTTANLAHPAMLRRDELGQQHTRKIDQRAGCPILCVANGGTASVLIRRVWKV